MISKKIKTKMMLALTGIALSTAATPTLACLSENAPKAYVYTELQISSSFDSIPWKDINENIKKQPGFINKTWLSGIGSQSVGGFYGFDSVEHAKDFVTNYFPAEAKKLGVAHTTKIFDAATTAEASCAMNSPYFTK